MAEKAKGLNYRGLLKKYMELVMDHGGFSYVTKASTNKPEGLDTQRFTVQEKRALGFL